MTESTMLHAGRNFTHPLSTTRPIIYQTYQHITTTAISSQETYFSLPSSPCSHPQHDTGGRLHRNHPSLALLRAATVMDFAYYTKPGQAASAIARMPLLSLWCRHVSISVITFIVWMCGSQKSVLPASETFIHESAILLAIAI